MILVGPGQAGRPPAFDGRDYQCRSAVGRRFCDVEQWRGPAVLTTDVASATCSVSIPQRCIGCGPATGSPSCAGSTTPPDGSRVGWSQRTAASWSTSMSRSWARLPPAAAGACSAGKHNTQAGIHTAIDAHLRPAYSEPLGARKRLVSGVWHRGANGVDRQRILLSLTRLPAADQWQGGAIPPRPHRTRRPTTHRPTRPPDNNRQATTPRRRPADRGSGRSARSRPR